MDLYKNVGRADHPTRRSRPVYRNGEWTYDTVALVGDVFPADPIEVKRFAHKLERVEARAYPPVPGAGEAEGAGADGIEPSGSQADVPEAEPALPDVIDVSLYHTGGGYYDLPNGRRVQGRVAALEALGVEVDGGD